MNDLPWKTRPTIMMPIVFFKWKNGNGPMIANPTKILTAPTEVTTLGGFLSQIRPHKGAEKPYTPPLTTNMEPMTKGVKLKSRK